ncbi:hypothetical protein KUTeg_016234 [Tegillarca granosa]|uniref:CABIT domain-containing protein n=1 Tax=Tegillarca granosa TaxID=220873 RepID=A0ABQ9EK95_TEGGR|nr:hypothetical protein KUTeg_016234 [Tegillarca granosa]
MDLNDPKLWNDENFTIEQIVKQKGLPQAVRVCEGFCGLDETINFSCGDYLALDSIKPQTNVTAKYIDQKGRSISSRFNIPIGYSGKVKLMYRHRVFKTVEELIKVFPRYVEVKKAITVHGEDKPFELPYGSQIELEKVFKSKGIMCKYIDKSFLLSIEDNIEWSSVLDPNEYTIKEIVDRWSLPQYVEFLRSDEKVIFWNIEAAIDDIQKYSGLAKLEQIVVQDVIVGHHKETGVGLQNAERNHRTIVMLPLDSQDIREIKVQLPIKSDQKIYDTLAVRKIVDDDINGDESCGLYRDIKYIQRERLQTDESVYENADDHSDPPTPPIPPKRYTLSKQESCTIIDPERRNRTFQRSVSCPEPKRSREQFVNRQADALGDSGQFASKGKYTIRSLKLRKQVYLVLYM